MGAYLCIDGEIMYWQLKGDIGRERALYCYHRVTQEYRMFGLGSDLGVKFGMIMREMFPCWGNTNIAL